MAVINETFARCTECENAYFEPKQVVLIDKTSDFDQPYVVKTITEYRCSQCNHLQYKREV